MKDLALEVIEKEIVGLAEEAELPPPLGSDDGGGAAAEAAVVDSGDSGLVVSEFLANFGFCYEGKLGLLGDVGSVAVGDGPRVFGPGRRIHREGRGGRRRVRVWNRQVTVPVCLFFNHRLPYLCT